MRSLLLRTALVATLLVATLPAAARGTVPAVKLGTGAWSWFADPRAVYGNGRTYVGWVSPSGDQVIGSWRPGLRTRTVLNRDRVADDHDAPAMAVLANGRIMALSSTHNGNQMRWRLTNLPGDVSNWAPLQFMNTNTPGPRGYTYPNPVRLPGERNRLYLFWRGGDWAPAFSFFRPDGSWVHARRLLKPKVGGRYVRPYLKFATRGRTIAFAFTDGHPRNVGRNGVHLALYRGRHYYTAGGRRIGTIGKPLDPRRADTIYKPRRGQARAWLQDVAIDRRGRPVVVYTRFPSTRSHRYRYAVFAGGRWHDRRLVAAGKPLGDLSVSKELYYSGGAVLDQNDPRTVYLSRTVRGRHQLERWRTRDGGRRWRHVRMTSSVPGVENFRPVVPRHLPRGKRQVLWLSGRYRTYHRFNASVMLATRAAPTPDAAFTQTVLGRTVAFDPAGSRATAAPVTGGRWTFGDGTSAPWTGRPVRHTYPFGGAHYASLELFDGAGRRDVLTREVITP